MSEENNNKENIEGTVSNPEGHIDNNPSNIESDSANNKSRDKLFTQEEVNKLIEKRLSKERSKQEKALKEAERLSKLSEEDRIKAEFASERQAFEEERQAYLKEKMLTQVEKELINESLPVEFAGLLCTDDADTTSENIKTFKEKWNKALEKAINEKLKSNARIPKKETNDTGKISWEAVLENPKLLKKYKEQNKK